MGASICTPFTLKELHFFIFAFTSTNITLEMIPSRVFPIALGSRFYLLGLNGSRTVSRPAAPFGHPVCILSCCRFILLINFSLFPLKPRDLNLAVFTPLFPPKDPDFSSPSPFCAWQD